MTTILDAKRHLASRFRNEQGFVGVGLTSRASQEVLRVYVVDSDSPVARRLNAMPTFEGFPLVIEVSGVAQAQGW